LREFCENHHLPEVSSSPAVVGGGVSGGAGMWQGAGGDWQCGGGDWQGGGGADWQGGGGADWQAGAGDMSWQWPQGNGGANGVGGQAGWSDWGGGGCGMTVGIPPPCAGKGGGFGAGYAPPMDPLKESLVARVKAYQKTSREQAGMWQAFCGANPGAAYDPVRHDVAKLQEFCALYGVP